MKKIVLSAMLVIGILFANQVNDAQKADPRVMT